MAPTSQEELDKPPCLGRAGRQLCDGHTARQAHPAGPTEGGAAAGTGRRALLGAVTSHPGPRHGQAWSVAEDQGLGLGAGAGLTPAAPAGHGKEGRGGVFIQVCASELLLFPFFPPPFLKAKAIIYRSFRFAVFSI